MYAFSQGFSCDAPEAHTLCVALNETPAPVEYLGFCLGVSAKRSVLSQMGRQLRENEWKASGISSSYSKKVTCAAHSEELSVRLKL